MVWSGVKEWLIQSCWSAFSLEYWKHKSQAAMKYLTITFILSCIAIIGVIFAYIDIHVWSKKGSVVLVPANALVEIQGQTYIPIKMLDS